MGHLFDRSELGEGEEPDAGAPAPGRHRPARALGSARVPRRGPKPGSAPGEMVVPADSPPPQIRVMSYAESALEERVVEHPEELRELVASRDRTLWIDVEGFGDEAVISEIATALGIHPLAIADVVHVPQRPKAELHGDLLLVIVQMVRTTEAGEIDMEQVSLVVGEGWVASFQDCPGDVFDPVRDRIRSSKTRIRSMGGDYLAYALLDAVVDGYFPVIEELGDVIDALEEEVVEQPSRATLSRIHAVRRALTTLHRVQWRQRDAIASILRDQDLALTQAVEPYLRDVHDHAFQTLDAIETFREMVVGLMDLYVSTTSNRLNEVMKTLTIVATIFIPLTFVSGVYGMNFDDMPELHWPFAYPTVLAAMVVLAIVLLLWFRHRGWLGEGRDRD